HHTEPHSLKGAKSAWHMIRRSDENAPAPSASFEDCGCVNSIFPRVSAFGFNNQSSIRYTELNQRIGIPPRIDDECRLFSTIDMQSMHDPACWVVEIESGASE